MASNQQGAAEPLIVQGPPDSAMCEKIGCVLALFCPIVGFVTFCVSYSAPKGSEKRKWAGYACITGSVVAIVSLVVMMLEGNPAHYH
eukprot:NODE_6266_length_518_cov_583.198704.p2 GENE.NODE_6266_length_518_cov_583.198704~~NODE_6266_length_518_cov_583.198704.p2  ORF type:complete len:87 (+),score=12.72 NODE_6266_length_518_cov_583.198704:43-303(+)